MKKISIILGLMGFVIFSLNLIAVSATVGVETGSIYIFDHEFTIDEGSDELSLTMDIQIEIGEISGANISYSETISNIKADSGLGKMRPEGTYEQNEIILEGEPANEEAMKLGKFFINADNKYTAISLSGSQMVGSPSISATYDGDGVLSHYEKIYTSTIDDATSTHTYILSRSSNNGANIAGYSIYVFGIVTLGILVIIFQINRNQLEIN